MRITAVSNVDSYSHMGYNRFGYEGCYEFSEETFYPLGSHYHDFYEIYIHLGGGQYFGMDNHIYEMQPNQLFIAPPFCMHGLVIEQHLINYERAFLYISLETMERLGCGKIDFHQFFQSRAQAGGLQFSMRPEDAQRCKNLMIELKKSQHDPEPLTRVKDYALIMSFLYTICDIVSHTTPVSHIANENLAIQNILTYVNENYTQHLKVAELASKFNVSVSYLAHEFKKYTGRSVYDYIIYRRMMLSKSLISSSESLSTVAEQCGFDNYSNFSRLFQKYFHVSPMAYKKQLLLQKVHR